eukprot:COSAG01_NODE_29503_length_636_cov_0.862197_1_plen_195_part_10
MMRRVRKGAKPVNKHACYKLSRCATFVTHPPGRPVEPFDSIQQTPSHAQVTSAASYLARCVVVVDARPHSQQCMHYLRPHKRMPAATLQRRTLQRAWRLPLLLRHSASAATGATALLARTPTPSQRHRPPPHRRAGCVNALAQHRLRHHREDLLDARARPRRGLEQHGVLLLRERAAIQERHLSHRATAADVPYV